MWAKRPSGNNNVEEEQRKKKIDEFRMVRGMFYLALCSCADWELRLCASLARYAECECERRWAKLIDMARCRRHGEAT